MRADILAVAAAHCTETSAHLHSGCGYPAPNYPGSFLYGPLFQIGSFTFNKPMLLAVICAAIVIAFFWAAFAKPQVVPRGVQNIGELGVLFVRDQILRPMMGKRGDSFLPFLVSLFFFIWVMNIMEIIPVAQFPANSEFAFPAALMLMVYGTYTYLGIKHRLFANMFAGHILLLVFTLATWYLLVAGIGLLWSATSFILTVVLTAFELLIQALQAYIFTILTAQYIGGALEPEH